MPGSTDSSTIAITGASGLIGGDLARSLAREGHTIVRLVRRPPQADADEIRWDPARGEIDAASLEGLAAVVHLAGESIAAGRWTDERKALIRSSRTEGTRFLCDTLARLRTPPRVLIAASAIGYYGDRGDEPVNEESGPGSGFLADVCAAWEAACEPARAAGIRVVNLRIGIVLSSRGGALARMLGPFRAGLGGRVGSGRQYISWIALEDLVRVFSHALTTDTLAGPVNAVAPNPVSNAEFTTTLGDILGRPTVMPLPAFAVRLAFGEMGQALLLEGARVLPARLLVSGFEFRRRTLREALQHELAASP